jgi:hypothetical protein
MQATYGANEVGDENFAHFVSNPSQQPARGRNFRITHLGDATPNAFRDVGQAGFRVIYPSYSITTGNVPFGGIAPNTTRAQVERLADSITAITQPQPGTLGAALGKASSDPLTVLGAHALYLNLISACY